MTYRGYVNPRRRKTGGQNRERLALWSKQNSELRASDPPRLRDGRRLIRVFPEWGTDLPLWESFTEHYLVDRDTFPISSDLLDGLAAWNAEWQNRSELDDLPDEDRWTADGHALVSRLRAELNGIAAIRAEFDK